MASADTELSQQIDDYTSKKYKRYVSWYTENAKISKTSFWVGLAVVLICALCLVFFPDSMDEMRFFQYHFDPTNAIKIGLAASILLALVSMYTTLNQWRRCLALTAQLQAECEAFQTQNQDDRELDAAAAFDAFQERVEAIMAASNPEVVAAIDLDNAKKSEA